MWKLLGGRIRTKGSQANKKRPTEQKMRIQSEGGEGNMRKYWVRNLLNYAMSMYERTYYTELCVCVCVFDYNALTKIKTIMKRDQ